MRHGHMIKGQQGRNDESSLSHHLLRERVIIIIILREKKHIGKNINTTLSHNYSYFCCNVGRTWAAVLIFRGRSKYVVDAKF